MAVIEVHVSRSFSGQLAESGPVPLYCPRCVWCVDVFPLTHTPAPDCPFPSMPSPGYSSAPLRTRNSRATSERTNPARRLMTPRFSRRGSSSIVSTRSPGPRRPEVRPARLPRSSSRSLSLACRVTFEGVRSSLLGWRRLAARLRLYAALFGSARW